MATIVSGSGGDFGAAGAGGEWEDASGTVSNGGDAQPTTVNGKVSVSKTTPNIRRWNPLGELSSYTYQISLYMITPDAYDAFIASGRENINILNNLDASCAGGGAYLVAQSGGINDTTTQRAPGFEFDYYIDNLRMEGAINPQETGSATFNYDISFVVTEPYGFSFVTNLKKAADSIAKYSKVRGIEQAVVNASRQFFIIGLRFLGYDKNGNVSPETFQRYYDVQLTDFRFKLDGKATVYNIKAVPIPIKEGLYVKRGMIDKGARNLTGNTVDDVLNALMTKLTNDQDKYKEKIIYKHEFRGEGSEKIGASSIVSPADVAKSKWPMSKLKDQSGVNAATAQKATPLSTERIISFEREIPIVQAISQIVTQSTYLTDAMKSIYKSTNEPDKKTDEYGDVVIDSEATVKWINISPQLSEPRWDKDRNDWVFNITYIITPYETPVIINPTYADKSAAYYGPVKRYRYWYTGENSEIIRYEQQLNNTFFTVALDPSKTSTEKPTPAPVAGDKRQPVARTGQTGVGLEAENSYVTSLYDPGAWAEAKIEILGDPDLLAYPLPSGDGSNYNPFYEKDGVTINPRSGQVFIEIDFKEAIDYNNGTGLMDINESILFWKYPPAIAEKVKGVSFTVKKITSFFRNGRFTQELDLIINTFLDATAAYETERQKAEKEKQDQAKKETPTGFKQETPVENSTPGGDPCVRRPENQSTPPNNANDDAGGFANKNPVVDTPKPGVSARPDPTKQDVNTRIRTSFGLQPGQENQSLINRTRNALGIPTGGTRPGPGGGG